MCAGASVSSFPNRRHNISVFLLFCFYYCFIPQSKDAFDLKPVDVVADLTTKDLVKRALAHGRHHSSSSPVPSMTSAEPQQQQQHRTSPQVSSLKVMSPKTIFLPPQFSSASLLLETSSAANRTSARATAADAVVGASATGDVAGRNNTKQASAPPLSCTPRSLSRSNKSSNRVGFGPLDAARVEKRGEEGGAQGNLAVTAPPASVEATDTVVTAKRGSWSRPIGPRPQLRNGGSSGGASGGAESDAGSIGSGGDGMRSSSSVKRSSWPKHRPKCQVVVVVDGDGVAESEEQQGQEAIESSREGGGLVTGRGTAVVVERGNTAGESSLANAGGSEVIGESGGGEVAADSRRNPVRSRNEGQSVVDPRVQAAVRDRD